MGAPAGNDDTDERASEHILDVVHVIGRRQLVPGVMEDSATETESRDRG